MDLQNKQKLHIAMFPWLAYGHIMPFFQVAMFLAEKGHHVSYISTPKNIDRLPQIPTNLSSRLSYIQLPLPQLDGLPEGAESTAELPIHKVPYLKKAHDLLQLPLTNFLQDSRVNWIIHDFISHWLPPVAAQLGVNSVFFSIYSAATLCFAGPPADVIAGRRQKPEDFTVVPEWIDFQSNLAFKPYETLINQDGMDDSVSDYLRAAFVLQDCRVVILRSCAEFEPDALRLLGKMLQKPVLPVGLLAPSLQDSAAGEHWPVLKDWLDSKENNSVVYAAFGTEMTLSQELLHELAYGLEKSGLPFIWIFKNRPLVEGESGLDHLLPPGFQDRVSGTGLVWTDWAPQLRILAHPSIGGFLTHSGWSSVIEALGLGRPLILLPGSSDTGLVARLMHSRRLGLEVERNEQDGSFTRDSVADCIRRVVVDQEGEPLRANARAVRDIFGSTHLSYKHLDEFTRFIENYTASTKSL